MNIQLQLEEGKKFADKLSKLVSDFNRKYCFDQETGGCIVSNFSMKTFSRR